MSTFTPAFPGRNQGQYMNDFAFAAIKADGTVVTWGNSDNGGDSSSVTTELINVQLISSSKAAFAALKTDGSVVTWGSSSAGGDSSEVASALDGSNPVTTLFSTETAFAAIRADGSVITWGASATGGDSSAVSASLDGTVDVASITATSSAFAALLFDGSVVTWGYSDLGGDSSSVSASLDGTTTVTEVYATGSAFAALREDGSVITWGDASDGGDSTSVSASIDGTTDVTEIIATTSAFAAIREDGSVITWGDSNSGGDSSSISASIDGTTDVSEIASSDTAFAALRTDGSVITWGDNTQGGDSSSISADIDGTIDVVEIIANQSAFAALRSDGSVITWGFGPSGGDQSAVSSDLDGTIDIVDIVATDSAFAALRSDGSVITWGDSLAGGDSSSVSSDLDGTDDVLRIFSTSVAFAALKEDGTVVTWGDVDSGGDSSSVSSELTSISAISSVIPNTEPSITTPTTVTYTDTSADDTFTDTTDTLTATDVEGDPLVYMFADGSNTQTGSYGSIALDRSTGEWTYSPDDTAIEGLKTTDSDTFDVIVTDGIYPSSTTITIDLDGANDDTVIAGDITGSVTEDDVLSANGTLSATDLDTGDTGFVSQTDTLGTYGSLSIDTEGNWTYTLDNDSETVQALLTSQSIDEIFSVSSAGGTTQDITITVNGQNDILDITSHTLDLTEGEGVIAGTVNDMDATYTAAENQTEITGLTFFTDGSYNFDTSDSSYDSMSEGDVQEFTFNYVVTNDDDESGESTLTITLTGTNDLPVLVEGESTLDATFTDTSGSDNFSNATGKITATDVESNNLIYSIKNNGASNIISGEHGVFQIDANTGDWIFYPDDEEINALKDDFSESFTILITDGIGFIETDITINYTGVDDEAIFTGDTTAELIEDTNTLAFGDLLIEDLDQLDVGVISQNNIEGDYGSFTITSDGKWTYQLNNSSTEVQDLTDEHNVLDIFTVTSAGGDTQDITFLITGNNDDLLLSDHAISVDEGDPVVIGSVANLPVDYAPTEGQEDIAGLILESDGSYTFDASDSAYDYLQEDENQLITFSFTATNEFGETGSADLVISITGVNDAPALTEDSKDLSVAYLDTNADDVLSQATGTLTATDADADAEDLVYFINEAGSTLQGTYGTLTVETGSGDWAYTPDEDAIEGLQDEASETFSLRVTDGIAIDSTELTITLIGSDDISSFSGDTDAQLVEDSIITVNETLLHIDRDTAGATIVAQINTQGTYGTFSISESGAWNYTLNNDSNEIQALTDDQQVTETFTVTATDNVTQDIVITITGSDDQTEFSGDISGNVSEDGTTVAIGALTFTGVDTGDTAIVSQTDSDGTYGTFSINSAGIWSYDLNNSSSLVQGLKSGDIHQEVFVISTEGGDEQNISITVTGSDDNTTFFGDTSGTVSEDGSLSANGTLVIDDADSNDAEIITQTDTAGTYGNFTINDKGEWSYNLNNDSATVQGLTDGSTVADTFTAQTLGGASQNITITLTGSDDPTEFTGDTTGAVTEDNTLTASGTLLVDDQDTNEDQIISQTGTDGAFGFFSINPSGQWTYILDNNHDQVQELAQGNTLLDNFTVEAASGATQQITITLTGADDPTSISGDISGSVTEDDSLSTSGTLIVEDQDSDEDQVIVQTGIAGSYGLFSISANGQWSYILDNDLDTVQNLDTGESLTETFTAETVKGSTQDITVTISGADDALALSDLSFEFNEDDATSSGSVSNIVATYSAADGQTDITGFELSDDGQYSFNPASEIYQSLANEETLDLSYNYQAVDSDGLMGTATINIQVTGSNDAPTHINSLKNINAVAGIVISYQIETDTFQDIDNNDNLTYTATLSDGSDLPDWLNFNSTTLTFSGTTEANQDITARITASDQTGESATGDFTINIEEVGEQFSSTEDDDLIIGSDQDDTALVAFLPSQYIFQGDILSGAEGDDELVSIEYIGFGYGLGHEAYEVDVLVEDLIDPVGDDKSNAAQLLDKISDLYLAYFGRAPDASGFTYWFKEIYTGGHTFQDAATAFSYSQEYKDTYPAGTDNRDFVESVYQNLFNREPDAVGWDYWEGRLDGGLEPDVFLLAVINGAYAPTSGEEDRSLLGNKHDVAVYYAEQSALNPEEGFDQAINDLLNEVTGDDETYTSAKAVIDHSFENDITLGGILEDQTLFDQLWG